MESFYSGKALRTHFFYAEPHNAEMYYRFAPWERRYRRWLYSPNPAEIGHVSRVFAIYLFFFMGLSSRKSSIFAVRHFGMRAGTKWAGKLTAMTMIGSLWQNRWAPTSGLNG
jgi:hypothetical protein